MANKLIKLIDAISESLHAVGRGERQKIRKFALLQQRHSEWEVVGRRLGGASVGFHLHFLAPADHAALLQSSWHDVIQEAAERAADQDARAEKHRQGGVEYLDVSRDRAGIFLHPRAEDEREEQRHADDVKIPRRLQVDILQRCYSERCYHPEHNQEHAADHRVRHEDENCAELAENSLNHHDHRGPNNHST